MGPFDQFLREFRTFSFANVNIEFFKLPMVCSTHLVARWSFTGYFMISMPFLLQKTLTPCDIRLVP